MSFKFGEVNPSILFITMLIQTTLYATTNTTLNCFNGLYYTSSVNNICNCLPGYIGAQCQYSADPCMIYPRCSHGKCINSKNLNNTIGPDNKLIVPQTTCECSDSYIGPKCEFKRDPCYSQIFFCGSNGYCVTLSNNTYIIDSNGRASMIVGSFTCVCKPPYYGQGCDLVFDPNPCNLYWNTNPCWNNGKCIAIKNNTLDTNRIKLTEGVSGCSCPNGFVGHACEYSDNPCTNSLRLCKNKGICNVISRNTVDASNNLVLGNSTCTCASNLTGPVCQFSTDPCAYNRCKNQATCLTSSRNSYTLYDKQVTILNVGKYTCVCVDGFIGTECNYNLDPCKQVGAGFCLGGGKCVTYSNSSFNTIVKNGYYYGQYKCACSDNFVGIRCQYAVDGCLLTNPLVCKAGYNCVLSQNGTDSVRGKVLCKCLNSAQCSDYEVAIGSYYINVL